jgi:hypothetical protein
MGSLRVTRESPRNLPVPGEAPKAQSGEVHFVMGAMRAEVGVFPVRSDAMSGVEAAVVMMNIALGTGLLQIGVSFGCGMVLGLLMTVVFAFMSFYGIWLFIQAASAVRRGTYAQIAGASIGDLFSRICTVGAVLTSGLTIRGYMNVIVENVRALILVFVPGGLPTWLSDQFTLSIIACVVIFSPMCISRSLRLMFILSAVEMAVLVFLLAHNVYQITQKAELLRTTKLVYFALNDKALPCMAALTMAYNFHPIAWPGLIHVRDTTTRGLTRIFMWVYVGVAVALALFGVSGYLANPLADSGTLVLDEFGDGVIVSVARIGVVVVMVCSIPPYMNAGQYSVALLFDDPDRTSHFTWASIGVLLLLGFASLGHETSLTWLGRTLDTALDVCDAIWQFLLPPVLYWSTFPEPSVHRKLAVLLFITGLGAIALVTVPT